MEIKLFSRFRSLREAYRFIEQDEAGVIRRRYHDADAGAVQQSALLVSAELSGPIFHSP